MFCDDKIYAMIFPIKVMGWTRTIGNYALFGAISRTVPSIHNENRVRMFPFGGLDKPPSCFSVRVPGYMVEHFASLEDQLLNVNKRALLVMAPSINPIRPARSLLSKIVVIHGFKEEQQGGLEAFKAHFDRALRCKFGCSAPYVIGQKKVIKVKDVLVDGFEVRIDSLSEADSMTIQSLGIGGRGHLGCGVFEKA